MDLLDLCAGRHHRPTFNVADMAIVAGAGIFRLGNIRKLNCAAGEISTRAASGCTSKEPTQRVPARQSAAQ